MLLKWSKLLVLINMLKMWMEWLLLIYVRLLDTLEYSAKNKWKNLDLYAILFLM